MTNFNNTTPINTSYAQSSGTASSNAFVHIFEDSRNPTENDVNYPVQKKWFNTSTGEFWMLKGFRTVDGVVLAIWVRLAAVGHVEYLQGDTGLIVGPDSASVINVKGDNTYITTVGTPLNHTLTIEPAGGLPLLFTEDTGTASAASGNIDIKGYTGIAGPGCGIETEAIANTIGIKLHSPFLGSFEFLKNTNNTPISLEVFNQSDTSGSDACLYLITAGTSSGDPQALFLAGNNSSVVMGYRNDNDTFVIGSGTGGITPRTAAQQIVLRPAIPDLLVQIPTVTQNVASSSGALFTIQNSDTSAGATVQMNMIAGSASSDCWITFNDFITSNIYTIGKTANSQLFKIGFGAPTLTGCSTILTYSIPEALTSLQNANVVMPQTCCVAAIQSTSIGSVTGDGTFYTIIFDTVIADQNSNYNSSTGLFTAPVTGNYLVSTAITLNGLDANTNTANQITISSPTSCVVNLGNLSAVRDVITNQYTAVVSQIIPLSQGDTFDVQIRVSGSTKTVGINGSPSGYITQLSVQLLC